MDLRAYLNEAGTTASAFAAAVQVSPQAIHRYLAGERIPRPEVMRRIQEASAGQVTPNDFFPAPASQAAA